MEEESSVDQLLVELSRVDRNLKLSNVGGDDDDDDDGGDDDDDDDDGGDDDIYDGHDVAGWISC